ncbi:DNA-directed RNA polymerase subunit beta' [endosymbiont of Sipalinus gigas]|nr:DNA-directed RNA polymerase subunit beta' [endosymbiont of Sipalinus gigas]BBA85270.1 DNA-directed RNA polymerase subunit beta' [endosymbiont of Sipalinus gigas]
MNYIFDDIFNKDLSYKTFNSIKISLASPEKIRSWSFGEVKKPETINYRTFKPERDGLFCAKIFGPIKDYECLCGKYKKIKYKGITCEKCGVEIISSKVRRDRMGHIELSSPIAHIWFLKSLPSRISLLLDISLKDVEKILYFENYIVVDNGTTNLKINQILTEDQYFKYIEKYGDEFDAKIGAEAIYFLLKKINLNNEYNILINEFNNKKISDNKKKKIYKRLKLIKLFIVSNNKPEWMILTVLPVIPPDLRPLVPIDGGRFATSDLNDLYRRIINRNNRLKRLIELSAPDIIIKNEKRMLQEAVDSLLDNGRKNKISSNKRRQLKSLSDMIKGKQGRFRQNLLGKRVDYSGRSVITVGPNLKLNQCGIPKKMALELFKPFIYGKLEKLGICSSIKLAKKMVENEELIVWNILEDIVNNYPILLNRAPTLHRLGIQSFYPILIEGKSIQLHPLVCTAYNADFDGDQMAIHIPLTLESKNESINLMMSTNNILSPANGEPIIVPSKDIILGIYYMTKEIENKDNNIFINNVNEVKKLYDTGKIKLHENINIKIKEYINNNNNLIENIYSVKTTVGRIILWDIIPNGIEFNYINKVLNKTNILKLIDICYINLGKDKTVKLVDDLMYLGFKFATKSGISINMNDFIIPKNKKKIIEKTEIEVENIQNQYQLGLITYKEKYNKVIDIWSNVNENISKFVMNKLKISNNSFNSMFMMIDSGARGSSNQVRQISGMRGLMSKPDGYIIETPIKANFKEGLNILEYFISTHGARKGLSDTALKTANSGYLTRRLVDVAQDIVITEYNCNTENGIEINCILNFYENKEVLKDKIFGRVLSKDIFDSNNNILLKKNDLIDINNFIVIKNIYIENIYIRSPITCESEFGLCALCYGIDLTKGEIVKIGEAVGVIAAQSIGEPGTQLTMRTFHVGGSASKINMNSNIKSKNDGILKLINYKIIKNTSNKNILISRNTELKLIDSNGRIKETYKAPYGSYILKKDKDIVKKNEIIAVWDLYTIPIISEVNGIIEFVDMIEEKTFTYKKDESTGLLYITILENLNKELRPMIKIISNNITKEKLNKTSYYRYFLPPKSIVHIKNKSFIYMGDIIAKIPQDFSKIKDITGGLPRISDLFEARKIKDSAILAEKTGIIYFGDETKGKKKITIVPINENDSIYEEMIPKWKHLSVFEGEKVEKGDIISDGQQSLHDILRLKGINSLTSFIINNIQEIYKFQGVRINNKHIEIIIKQMLKKVTVVNKGDSNLLEGEQIKLYDVRSINKKLKNENKELVKFEYNLIGITKSSLLTDSFISSASFQETTKVLTESSISGKIDKLKGLKENIIVGRLIPAGTGYKYYKKTKS